MQPVPPAIVPALSTPTLGQTSFPNELLRCVLLHVHPKDLTTLAAANRHLHSAVAACIDSKLAEHHISQTIQRIFNPYADTNTEPEPPEKMLDRIPFKHPLLRYHHTVAALCRHGISSADQIWGTGSRKRRAMFPDQVRALCAAVRKRFGRAKPDDGPLDIFDLECCIRSQWIESSEVFNALLDVIAEAVLEHPETSAGQEFFIWCAEKGSTEGLALIPLHHPMLSDDITWPLQLLRITIENKHLPAIRLLLEKGAVVSIRITSYLHPDDDPTNLEILRLLLQHGFDPNWYFHDQDERYFDQMLVEDKTHDFVKLLLEHGGDANARDNNGFTLLHHCARSTRPGGNPQCRSMPLFLDAGADIDAIGGAGFTALGMACVAGNMEAIRILLDRGAGLNVSCEWPPLHATAKRGTPDVVKLLLDAGAQVNFRASNGKTALDALLEGPQQLEEMDRDKTTLLLEAGAELDETGADGKTAWRKLCAAARHDGRLLRWVLERGGLRGDKIEEVAMIQEWLLDGAVTGVRKPLP
ncbi:hypothetical protein HDU96_006487 [Phlyctochytrium bullatum]|nr:hypothetical protein HDU96_006487 [Phlyctochytrium bullatum]